MLCEEESVTDGITIIHKKISRCIDIADLLSSRRQDYPVQQYHQLSSMDFFCIQDPSYKSKFEWYCDDIVEASCSYARIYDYNPVFGLYIWTSGGVRIVKIEYNLRRVEERWISCHMVMPECGVFVWGDLKLCGTRRKPLRVVGLYTLSECAV